MHRLGSMTAKTDGSFRLLVDHSVDIQLRPMGKQIHISADLGPLPASDFERGEIFRHLLQQALVQIKSVRESLSLDPERNLLVLYRTSRGQMDLDRLNQLVGDFVNSYEFFSGILSGDAQEPVPYEVLIP